MNEVIDFFRSDWDAMTSTDWTGFWLLLVIAAIMVVIYVVTLRPSNRDKFEQYRDFVNHEQDRVWDRESNNERSK
ncbi:MAG: cbb3-type cytochrome c oxidase subunit 3 [Zetaproteobacteria bacterium]|nr:cbb3-type cytochrome c oxidase subunit 3 [Zetaproteobacteria bacterium]